jgi:PAS domain S-box-containing protein
MVILCRKGFNFSKFTRRENRFVRNDMMLHRFKKYFQYYYLAVISFLLIFLLTLFVYYDSREQSRLRSDRLFELKTEQAKVAIEGRVLNYIQILKGAKGLFMSSDSVDRQDWKKYVSTLNIEENFPGIQGIGFVSLIEPTRLPQHLAQVRAEGFPEYALHPAGEREVFSSIVFIEPFSGRNLRAFGYDMYSDETRRLAMDLARDTNQPTLSGKVRLVQETEEDVQAGFLIYLPVYSHGFEPITQTYRRKLLSGFVYSPFRVNDLMQNLLGPEFQDLDIEIFDGKLPSRTTILYQKGKHGSYFSQPTQDQLSKLITLNIGGHVWTLYFAAPVDLGSEAEQQLSRLILAGGLVISLLMFSVVWTLSKIRKTNLVKQIITDNATAALFTIDRNGFCTFMNPAAEKMTGYTLEELRHKPLHDYIHYSYPDGRPFPIQECPIGIALSQKKDLHGHENVFIRKDGTFFDVSCSARSLQENGVVVSTILEVRDITEEKKSQMVILESEARFRTMADSAPVMIWINDDSMNTTYVNKQWLSFTGQTLAEAQEVGWLAAIHPDDMDYAVTVYEEALKKKEEFKVEYRFRRQDGVYRWMVVAAIPRFNPNGDFMGYTGSVIDITERMEAEQRVKENADLLQGIFRKVPAVVGLIRASDKTYLLANPVLSRLFNNRLLLGRSLQEAHPEPEEQGLFALVEQVILTAKPMFGKEVAVTIDRQGDGQAIIGFFNLVYQPVFNEKQQVEAVLVFGVDVTELVEGRKELTLINEKLNLKNEELLRINNDLDSFVYTASHDLKSPIANLEGLATVLQESLGGKLNQEDLKVLHLLGLSVNKLKKTIADLTDITRVQKQLTERHEHLLFEEILEDVKADIESLVASSGGRVITEFKMPEIVYARKNLRSILYNLLSNAIKYRSPDRPLLVRVRTKQVGTEIVFSVQDNGLGIKSQHLHKLFSMFTRLHNHVEGTGIGLYMIKRIIENNGGSIHVDSEIGKGTRFTVRFKNTVWEPTMVS